MADIPQSAGDVAAKRWMDFESLRMTAMQVFVSSR